MLWYYNSYEFFIIYELILACCHFVHVRKPYAHDGSCHATGGASTRAQGMTWMIIKSSPTSAAKWQTNDHKIFSIVVINVLTGGRRSSPLSRSKLQQMVTTHFFHWQLSTKRSIASFEPFASWSPMRSPFRQWQGAKRKIADSSLLLAAKRQAKNRQL